MRVLKRLLLILTSLTIMLTTCACSFESTGSSDDDDSEVTEATTTASPIVTTTGTSAEEAEESDELDMDLVMGSIVDGVYVNEYFDFSFAPGSTWYFYDDDELLEDMGIEVSTLDERQEALSEQQLLTTSIAYDSVTSESVYTYAENMDILYNGNTYTLEQYAQRDVDAFDYYTFSDMTEITIGSYEYLYMLGSRKHEDGYVVYAGFVYKKVDNYIFTAIITTFNVDVNTVDDIISWMSDADTPSTLAYSSDVMENYTMSDIMGYVSEDGVYINEYFDFSFAPPSTWAFYTDDELLEDMGIDPDSITTDEEREDVLSQIQLLKPAIATDLTTINSVDMYAENLNMITNGDQYDEYYYAENDRENFEEQGVTFSSNPAAVTIGSHRYLLMTGEYGNSNKLTFLYRRVGDYMFTIMIWTYNGYNIIPDDIIERMSDADTPVKEEVDMLTVMGSVVDDTYYVNEYFDVMFTPDSNWILADDDYVLSFMEIDPEEANTDDKMREALSQVGQLYTMFALEVTGYADVFFMAENLNVDDGDNLYTSIECVEDLGNQMEELGYEVSDTYTTVLGSYAYDCIQGYTEDDGYEVWMTFLCRRVGNFTFCIEIDMNNYATTTLDDILSWITDVK
ncbi:MAG: hypothetical protein LUG49_05280 [Oscillospiraceae bacterium]|nr:hypothetical protein [Oscillospiraceae bacterium]